MRSVSRTVLVIGAAATTLIGARLLWAAEPVDDVWSHFGSWPGITTVRLDLDVTGDGEPEIFLTKSQWEKAGSIWNVYSPRGPSFLFLGKVRFHETLFDFDAREHLLTAWQPIAIGRFRLVEYRITSEDIAEIRSREMTDNMDDSEMSREAQRLRAAFDSFRKSERYTLSVATTEELKSDQAGQEVWKDYQTRRPVAGLRRIVGVSEVLWTKGAAPPGQLRDHFLSLRPHRHSGAVFLIELDVTGDGAPEVFLNKELRHPSLGWLVYSPSSAGYRYLGELAFDPARIRYGAEENELVVLRSEPKVVAYHRIDASGIRLLREVDWSMNWSRLGWPEKEKMAAWRSDVDFEILTLSVEELEEDPETAVWKELGTGGERATSVDFSLAVSGDGSR